MDTQKPIHFDGMRKSINQGAVRFMQYGIREIVDTAQQIRERDPNWSIIPENIGDPIPKGWPVPPFLKDLLKDVINDESNKVFGYSHSRGLPETRKWVTQYAKRFSPSSELDYEYVLFTSGLGAAISALYHMFEKGARVLQPTPAYPTHVSLEAYCQQAEGIRYNLDPDNDWQPDVEDMEAQILAHPDVTGLLVINPNNPTGAVYSAETIEKIVQLAEKYGLMIIADEVYFRMVYNGHEHAHITEIAHNRVPLIVMRGMSKDVPWPGGRCGWLEFHNTHLDPSYKAYCESVKKRILMEVCSVTMPQMVAPKVYDHPDYEAWISNYNSELETNGNFIAETLSAVPYLKVNRTNGAFYMMPLFKDGVLNNSQTLPIENDEVRKYIESEVSAEGFPLDKRFCYFVLASTGICVVPASGFFSLCPGFRLTTLDRDPVRAKQTYETLVRVVKEYVESSAS
ncbi:MAG: pyridoxal phosphate-dependent aminotransferase [Candidatus Peregrinibacteria bacterium]|nr:pyridoxal phosphate-dependent aminotransferase [Candidatus Peregrinibacteria bacterium]MDZ4244569.1 pyridoxal phosphate-dependent aminotransferase [Candidatus Gracilibacteria bacterium]